MTLREGPQALDAQRLGRAAEALHLALLQSMPPAPGEESVIRLFAACPKEWNARFTLLARGGFLVTAAIEEGRDPFGRAGFASRRAVPAAQSLGWSDGRNSSRRWSNREPDRAFACVSDRQRGKNRSQASLAARTRAINC